jgi:hypothetical protein
MSRTILRTLVARMGLVLPFLSGIWLPAARSDDVVSFNRDIRPILSNNCYQCHGPDEKERKADLRLDTEDGMFADLGGHAAVVRGKPDESEMILRVRVAQPGKASMPPKKSGKKLTAQEIDLLARWVRQGAPYARHWSYIKPNRPALPAVKDASWPKTPIDHFLLARLEREGLKPTPEADRYALIRRVSLDLTGLPPSLKEVDTFVKDPDPAAYEKLVDRLLDKSSYGEHWARMWLDLARYADSAGYADDPPRTIWLYRDYVIKALNANRPFDRFTIEQIAGDLLPNATEEQLIASAFHRNTLTNNEGGTSDEEFRNVAVVDRVNTTMAVWMGTTIACAQCHNHKYDPITQEEFFRFFAILNNTEDSDKSDESPVLSVLSLDQMRQRERLQAEIDKLDVVLRTPTPEIKAGQAKWEQSFPLDIKWTVLKPSGVKSQNGATFTVAEDGAIRFAGGAKTDTYSVEIPLDATTLRALKLEALPDPKLPGNGPGHAGGNFIITRVTPTLAKPQGTPQPVAFNVAVADYSQAGFEPENLLQNKDPKTKGWAVGGETGRHHALTLALPTPLQVPAGSKLTVTIEQSSQQEKHTLGHLRLSATGDTRAVEAGRVPQHIIEALKIASSARTGAQTEGIDKFYLGIAGELQAPRQRRGELAKQLAAVKPSTVPIMRELKGDQRRRTHIQHRGNFLDLGKEVTEGTPSAFAPLPDGSKPDRLALARWLVDENNPLTARVIANRFWEQIFGIGIVASSEEFGTQGELPFHPELLDWLATELVRLKWDMKAFLKMLVTSAAYRQSSRVTPELQQRDPDNRLLGRGPRFRLSAEELRDQALFVSGLLSAKMYGPPVKPPQPALGISAAFGSGIDWQTSAGEDRYRRGLYTTWRRSNPYPSMATFDAPNREVCTLRRVRTNTPLQALVTLNDPVYIEAAQALARKVLAEGGSTTNERANYAFRLCLSRPPHEDETARLVRLYEQSLTKLQTQPDKAKQLAAEPIGPLPAGANAAELAAWTTVGNVLLNLDEMLMKR